MTGHRAPVMQPPPVTSSGAESEDIMTQQEFYKAGIERSNRTGETLADIIKAGEPATMNDMRALLKMLRLDTLPEPARSLAEELKRKI